MKKHLLILLSLVAAHSAAFAQATVKFTDLDGFPSVIVSGQTYNLTGYITNIGITSSPAVLDIKMLANGTVTTISNNFSIPGGLAPGDTIPWFENGFSFSSANLVPNNNDVIIWPTGPSNGDTQSDSLIKSVYYSEQAGFKTTTSMVIYNETGDPMDFAASYPLTIKAVNLGKCENSGPVHIYVAANENGRPVELQRLTEMYRPGDTLTYYHNSPFYPKYAAEESMEGLPYEPVRYLRFWAQESLSIAPIAKGEVEVVNDPYVSISPSQVESAMAIANHPVSNRLSLKGADEWIGSPYQIMDMQGRTVMSGQLQASFSIGTLAPGRYFLSVTKLDNSATLPFTKQ